jgi:hypothetical protein
MFGLLLEFATGHHASFHLTLANVWFIVKDVACHTMLRYRWFILLAITCLKCGVVFVHHNCGVVGALVWKLVIVSKQALHDQMTRTAPGTPLTKD